MNLLKLQSNADRKIKSEYRATYKLYAACKKENGRKQPIVTALWLNSDTIVVVIVDDNNYDPVIKASEMANHETCCIIRDSRWISLKKLTTDPTHGHPCRTTRVAVRFAFSSRITSDERISAYVTPYA